MAPGPPLFLSGFGTATPTGTHAAAARAVAAVRRPRATKCSPECLGSWEPMAEGLAVGIAVRSYAWAKPREATSKPLRGCSF